MGQNAKQEDNVRRNTKVTTKEACTDGGCHSTRIITGVNERLFVEGLLETTRGKVHVAIVIIDETVRGADAFVGHAGTVEVAGALVVSVAIQIEAKTSELAAVRRAMRQQRCKVCARCSGAIGKVNR